jgi:hypothetical protein
MSDYLTIGLKYPISDTTRHDVVLESVTLDRNAPSSRIDLSQRTMQEIWDRNKDRIGDPRYDVNLDELFRLD